MYVKCMQISHAFPKFKDLQFGCSTCIADIILLSNFKHFLYLYWYIVKIIGQLFLR